MIRRFDYEIAETENRKTILEVLKSKGYSHAVIVHLKRTPMSILLNGNWEYVNTHVKTGDLLQIELIENDGSSGIIPSDIPLDIYYEDEDILVINKPAGMPVHPSQGHHENTLANAVCGYFATQGIPYTFRCVNRLDRDTSGLVLIAKHMLSAAILNQDIKNRRIHREYLAIADGQTPTEGTIDAPIARKDDSTIERMVDYERGEHAITHYKRISCTDDYSLLSLHLDTGRTHQIRVHMKYLGHPLLGDFLYHPAYTENFYGIKKESPQTDSPHIQMPRQALHSHRLQFTHPITGIPMDFTAPLPADMAALVSQDTVFHKQSAHAEASHV